MNSKAMKHYEKDWVSRPFTSGS